MFKRSKVLLAQLKKIINVAEKPSVARTITEILSDRNFTRSFSYTKFNPVYEFSMNHDGNEQTFIFTSGRGHIMNYVTSEKYAKWNLDDIEEIYDSELVKSVDSSNEPIRRNLQKYGK
jgi:DNA topoisomerase-3